METMIYFSDKYRTVFIGTSTYGYHIVPMLSKIIFHIIRDVFGYVNANLFHYLDSLRINLFCWAGSGRSDNKTRVKRLQKAMCHLTAAAIAGAKNKYFHNIQLKR